MYENNRLSGEDVDTNEIDIIATNLITDLTRTKSQGILEKNLALTSIKNVVKRYLQDEKMSQLLLNHPLIQEKIGEFREQWQAYEREFEKQFVEQFFNDDKKEFYSHIERNLELAKREGVMADITKNTRVLVMGGGALPMTAITYNNVFNAKCRCIDIDQNAVEISSNLLRCMGLEQDIHPEYGDATSYPLEDIDVAIITTHCRPKNLVFKHIAEHSKRVKVIARNPINLSRLLYHEFTPQDIEAFELKCTDREDIMCPVESTLLLHR